MILAWTGDELSRGQAQNEVNFDFEVKFYLEGQGQSSPKTIGILTKVFYTFGPNLVISAWTDDELSRGQASAYRTHRRTDGRTDGHTDRQTQATTIPEGQNWPRVKTKKNLLSTVPLYYWKHPVTACFLIGLMYPTIILLIFILLKHMSEFPSLKVCHHKWGIECPVCYE